MAQPEGDCPAVPQRHEPSGPASDLLPPARQLRKQTGGLGVSLGVVTPEPELPLLDVKEGHSPGLETRDQDETP